MTTNRARYFTGFWLFVTLMALLALGVLKQRQAFLKQGLPDGLPEPITGGGPRPGINVYLEQHDDTALAENLAQISAAGIETIKQSFYYSDSFDWQASDRIVTAVTRHNLTLVPLLDGDPSDNFAPIDPDTFAAWAGQFAARYAQQVQHYIIWDEPNLSSHWGGEPVNAIEYAALLTAAAQAVRAADSDAVIIAAPLAPTVESGPLNLADPLYLHSLYEAGAAAAFDAAAAKPYGFATGPDDRRVAIDHLNFSRAVLLRQVMVQNGDGGKAIWAGNWGWNSLPLDWDGQPSLWGQTETRQQVDWMMMALTRARQEWPWMGMMFLENWEPNAPAADPHWGFSLKSALLDDQRLRALLGEWPSSVAYPGFHLADAADPAQVYRGGWRFSPAFGADISEPGPGKPPDAVNFTFWGTDVGLRVRRADFRARLYVTVDGRPANALPRDENGSMLILTAADPADDYVRVEPVARNLTPGVHTMEVVAARGWDQWALHGFSVGYQLPDRVYRWGMAGLSVTAVLAFILAIRAGRKADWGQWEQALATRYGRWGQKRQMVVTAVFAAIVALTGWLTWGQEAAGLYRRLGSGGQLALTAAAASIFYVTPSFFIYLAALAALFLLIYLRPAWGVALIALTIPFYVNSGTAVPALLQPKPIFNHRFSPVEIYTLVTAAALAAKWLSGKVAERQITHHASRFTHHASHFTLHPIDYAVLTFTAVATLSLFFTQRLDVATNEWRVVIIEPALFCLLLRTAGLIERERWVVLDAFVLGGLMVALYGLWQYGFDRASLITAEGGLLRLRSIYGSPNNVALYLGRILPLLAAMALLGQHNGRRRWAYAIIILPIGLAILLTFSKGALFLGLPAALLFIFWRWQRTRGRRTWPWLIAFSLGGMAVFLLAPQIPQLAGRLDLRGETGVFRLNLWRASLNMIADHPWLGVGLDNFLYAYRGRYIFDAAWQEPNLNHPHNIILDFATRLGLLGLLAGGWMIAWLARLLWQVQARAPAAWTPVAVGFGAALVDSVAHGLVDHSFFLVDLAFAFYLMLGTAVWLDQVAPGIKSRNFTQG